MSTGPHMIYVHLLSMGLATGLTTGEMSENYLNGILKRVWQASDIKGLKSS